MGSKVNVTHDDHENLISTMCHTNPRLPLPCLYPRSLIDRVCLSVHTPLRLTIQQ